VPAVSKIYVGIGKKDGATVNDLVAVLTKEIRVDRTRIGRVELKEAYALVEIPAQEAERIAAALNGTTIRRKRVIARVDRGPARPSRPARPARRS
jgi:ATP-dependent RNA helicase DeaD